MLFELSLLSDVLGLAATCVLMLALLFKGDLALCLLVFAIQILLFW